MTWIQLDCEWGVPCIRLELARPFLRQGCLGPWGEIITESVESRQRLEAWIADVFKAQYPGAQLIALRYAPEKDALSLTVMHPDFPRTKPYHALPCWQVYVHAADTEHPSYTISEEGS